MRSDIPFSKNSEMDDKPPDHVMIADKECVFENSADQTQSNVALDRSLQKCGVDFNEEGTKQLIDTNSKSVTEMDEIDERPKIRRKRSSSLSSLVLLKQDTVDDQYDKIKLRRVSSIPCNYSSGSTGGDTQLEDGLLTTTLCSTEL